MDNRVSMTTDEPARALVRRSGWPVVGERAAGLRLLRHGHPRPGRRGGGAGVGALGVVGLRGGRADLPAAALDRPDRGGPRRARVGARRGWAGWSRCSPRSSLVAGLLAWLGAGPALRPRRRRVPAAGGAGDPGLGPDRRRPRRAGGPAPVRRGGVELVAENGLRCAARDRPAHRRRRRARWRTARAWLAGYAAAWPGPSALRLRRDETRADDRSALRFLGGALGGQLLGQAVLTGGPVAAGAGRRRAGRGDRAVRRRSRCSARRTRWRSAWCRR